MNQSDSLYKPKFNSRPYSSQSQGGANNEEAVQGLSLQGEKIKKGIKIPEKYKGLKPQFIKSSSPLKEVTQQKQSSTISEDTDYTRQSNQKFYPKQQKYQIQQSEQIPQQQPIDTQQQARAEHASFETYMQLRMINPEVKKIYQNVQQNNKEEQKQLSQSKPFSLSKTSYQAKQSIIGCNPSKVESDRSTQQSITNQQQIQLKDVQSMSDFDTKSINLPSLSEQNENSIQGNKQLLSRTTKLKLTDMVVGQQKPQIKPYFKEKSKPQLKFDNSIWKVHKNQVEQNTQVQQLVDERQIKIQQLNEFILDLKKKNKVPKDFDKYTEQAYNYNNIYNNKPEESQKEGENGQEIQEEIEETKKDNDNAYNYDKFQKQDPLEKQMCEIETKVEQQEQQKKMQKLIEESAEQLSEMSSEEIQQRMLFLTEFGRKSLKFHKLQDSQISQRSKQIQIDNQADINFKKNKGQKDDAESNQNQKNDEYYVILNKKLAWLDDIQKLQFQSEIDKLPQDAQNRLNELLADIENIDTQINGQITNLNNPFQVDQNVQNSIDEKLRKYLVDSENESILDLNNGILNEQVLPKDKNLRNEAESRIIREQLNYVNSELLKISTQASQKKMADSTQIQALCQELRNVEEISEDALQNIKYKQKDFETLQKLNDNCEAYLKELEKQTDVMKDILDIKQVISEELAKVQSGDLDGLETEENSQQLMENLKERAQSYKQFENLEQQFKEIEEYEIQVNQKIENLKHHIYTREEELYLNNQEQENKPELTIELIQQKYPVQQADLAELDKQIEEKAKKEHPELFE